MRGDASMNRFLYSLAYYTNKNRTENIKIRKKCQEMANEYDRLKERANSTLAEKRMVRQTTRSCANSSAHKRNVFQTENESLPEYLPASQYAVPIQPRFFKPQLPSFNADRIHNLSKLRCRKTPQKPLGIQNVNNIGLPSIGVGALPAVDCSA